MEEKLLEITINDLPPDFTDELLTKMAWVYKEAKSKAFEDPDYEKPEARYLLPHFRRALTEVVLRKAANNAKMPADIRRASSGGYEYSIIQAGRLSLTVSYVDDYRRLPRPSKHRAQYSEINRYLSQREIEFEPRAVKSTPGEGAIYGIILHGPEFGNDEMPGFIRIGFPRQNCESWIDETTIDLYDVRDKQIIRYQKAEEERRSHISAVEPKLKTIDNVAEGEN